jgi:VWFA-related protein
LCPIFAQEQSPSDQKVEKREDQSTTIRVDTDLVLIDVKVTDRGDGHVVTGLQAGEFAVYEDGVAQQIALFSATNVPLSLVLVIDTSGSTQSEVGLMRRAARRFLDELRPQDRVAVVAFSQEIELLSDLTSDQRKTEHALGELQPGQGTAFYDALAVTVAEVLNRAEGRKAVVVLTDGVDSYGRYTYSQLLPELEKGQAAIYVLEIDTEAFTVERLLLDCSDDRHFRLSHKQLRKYAEKFDPGAQWWSQQYCRFPREKKQQITKRLYELAHQELHELASRTGGRVYPVKALQALGQVYGLIAAELRTQYAIGYYPSNERRDGKWRTLRVQLKADGLVAQTKPGYRAPRD